MKNIKKNGISKVSILIISITVVVIIAAVVIIVLNNNKNQAEKLSNKDNTVETLYDGTKINTSSNIKKSRTLDGLEIKNMSIISKSNETILEADVTNKDNKVNGDFGVTIIAKDKENKELIRVAGYINKLEINENTKLKIKTSFDFADVYDIEIIKD